MRVFLKWNYLFMINLIYVTIILILVISHYDLSESLRRMKKVFEMKNAELDMLRRQDSKWQSIQTRDFIRYECQNIKRLGGLREYQRNAPDPLYRIDGAW